MNVLVLTSEPISSAQLRDAIAVPVDPTADAQVLVIPPRCTRTYGIPVDQASVSA